MPRSSRSQMSSSCLTLTFLCFLASSTGGFGRVVSAEGISPCSSLAGRFSNNGEGDISGTIQASGTRRTLVGLFGFGVPSRNVAIVQIEILATDAEKTVLGMRFYESSGDPVGARATLEGVCSNEVFTYEQSYAGSSDGTRVDGTRITRLSSARGEALILDGQDKGRTFLLPGIPTESFTKATFAFPRAAESR